MSHLSYRVIVRIPESILIVYGDKYFVLSELTCFISFDLCSNSEVVTTNPCYLTDENIEYQRDEVTCS